MNRSTSRIARVVAAVVLAGTTLLVGGAAAPGPGGGAAPGPVTASPSDASASVGSSPATSPDPGLATSAEPASLQALVASTQFWVGENDLLLDLLDQDGNRLDDPALQASVELTGPDGVVRGTFPLERIRLADRGRYLYRARVPFDAVGPWAANVSGTTDSGQRLDGVARFEVLDDDGTPALGQPAIPVQNPTIATGAPLADITSDPNPVPQLYWQSVAEALDAGRPFLYVVDTARPGVNAACGSSMGEARIMRGNFPGLAVIHAEPYVLDDGHTVLTRPDQGPGHTAPWAAAWGVTDPPWMFVVAPDGTVSAKFRGVFGTDELLSALRRVAPFAPGGH